MKISDTYESQRKTLLSNIKSAATQWFSRACQDPSLPQFLFFKPGSLQVTINASAPDQDWQCANAAPVSGAMTQQQVQHWAFNVLRECPVYPA